MTRHREGMALHYGRDDFKDDARLVRALSRERTKDVASDYRQVDPVKEYAERRGIRFGERVMEMARAGAEKARGIFDGLRLSLPGQQREPSRAPDPRRGIFAGLALSGALPTTERHPRSEEHT